MSEPLPIVHAVAGERDSALSEREAFPASWCAVTERARGAESAAIGAPQALAGFGGARHAGRGAGHDRCLGEAAARTSGRTTAQSTITRGAP